MYSLNYILIHNPEHNENNTLGLLYDCTWDEEEGMGIKLVGFNVVDIGIQGSQF